MKVYGWRALILAGGLGLSLALLLGAPWGHRASPAMPTTSAPAVDPHLVVRPHTVRLDVTLPRGVRLEGTLTPAIPGPNNIHLVAQPGAIVGSRLDLEATMPGMVMTPVTATLMARGREYHGALTLPMFGRYRLRVTLAGGNTRPARTIELPLLPSWAGLPVPAK